MKFSCFALFLLGLFAFQSAQAKSVSDAREEACSQPGRVESAKRLLAQNKDFKLKASQFHLEANQNVNSAKKLQAQTSKLMGLTGAAKVEANKEFKGNLQAFKDHAQLYRQHLEQVEKQLGSCKESEAEYNAHLKEYSLHVEAYHLPNIRPPHICPTLQVSERQSAHMANSMREDQMRVARAEASLAASENKLENAMEASMGSDANLIKRSRLAEEERKLAGEFAALKTEYGLLKVQQAALLGNLQSQANASKTVSGKIKMK
ncbi:MAG: hypothetical protein K2X27_23825 [Candidatus Obscuribacterales bacterium]|nr:hypothetical protein [Candidatus Obscuribacterales bacterium]